MSYHCPICDARAEVVNEESELKLGRRAVVVEHQLYRCPECGEAWYTPDQMDRAQRSAADRIRANEGLLDPDEIRTIREKLELSQADFERLLCFGPKTVGRWERGSVFQNRSSDLLMRIVRNFPDVVRFLAGRQDVELPRDGEWPAKSQRKVSEAGLSESQAFRSTDPVPKAIHDIFRPTHSGFAPLVLTVRRDEEAPLKEVSEVS